MRVAEIQFSPTWINQLGLLIPCLDELKWILFVQENAVQESVVQANTVQERASGIGAKEETWRSLNALEKGGTKKNPQAPCFSSLGPACHIHYAAWS